MACSSRLSNCYGNSDQKRHTDRLALLLTWHSGHVFPCAVRSDCPKDVGSQTPGRYPSHRMRSRRLIAKCCPGHFVSAFFLCCVMRFCLVSGEYSCQHTRCQTPGPSGAHRSFLSRRPERPPTDVRERLMLQHAVMGILVFVADSPLRTSLHALGIRGRVRLHIAGIGQTFHQC